MNDTHKSAVLTATEGSDDAPDESMVLGVDELAIAVGGAIIVEGKPPPPPPPGDYRCC